MVECCRVPEFYYGSCEVRGGTWGELLECPEIHSESGHLVEGFCESGTNYACNGHASEVEMIRTFLNLLFYPIREMSTYYYHYYHNLLAICQLARYFVSIL